MRVQVQPVSSFHFVTTMRWYGVVRARITRRRYSDASSVSVSFLAVNQPSPAARSRRAGQALRQPLRELFPK